MNTIKITTQAEFDALPDKFAEYTQINIHGNITITKDRESSHVVLRESSSAVLWGSSSAELRESSSAVLWGSSSAVLRESSSAELWGSSSAAVYSSSVTIDGLFFWAVLTMCLCVCKVLKKHKTATIVHQVRRAVDKKMFLQTLDKVKEGYILFKSVKPDTLCDFQTGKIKYEGVVTCPDWDADANRECGAGLHLSPTPQMALSYHTGTVLRCAVKPRDFVIYQAGDFTKVRCKRVTVLGKAE